jgi:hypothetical protein
MKTLIAALLALSSFSSFAKIMTKNDVAVNFSKAVKSCECILKDYDLDEASVEVSLPENLLALATEPGLSLFEDADVYEIHADFYKDGKRFHFNNDVIVKYEGLLTDHEHQYSLELPNFTAFGDRPLRLMEGKSTAIDVKGNVAICYRWKSKKELW